MNIAQLWQICLDFEYDQHSLVSSLAQWIDDTGGHTILDAACGTGFPSIELLKRGYKIICSDGSATMLQEFRRNAAHAGISIEPHCVLWRDLARQFEGQFDIVLCRGSSLIYAGAWEEGRLSNKEAIREALENFYRCLRKNGILYVDTTSEYNLSNVQLEHRQYHMRVIDGQRTKLSETIETDKINCVRTWKVQVTTDQNTCEFERKSHFLPHSELMDILYKVGFERVLRPNIVGEHYAVFTALRS